MTSGARTPETRRRLLGAALLALLGARADRGRAQASAQPNAPTGAPAGAFDLAALMTLLARHKSGRARFTEERFVSGFDAPLHSSGLLGFTAPDRFTRETLEPRPESMEVSGRLLTLRRGGRTRQLTLDAAPELTALVEAMRGTLAGDAALLRRHFELRLAGNAALWMLALEPRDAQLAGQVRSVQLAGQGGELRSVELLLAGGDRSLMLIDPLPPAGDAAPRSGR